MSRWELPPDRGEERAWTFTTSDDLIDREVTVTVSRRWPSEGRKKWTDRAIVRLREWGRLHYPSIIKLYDLFFDQDRMFIVTERHNGETLQTHLDSLGSGGKLQPNRLQDLVVNLGSALGYAHAHETVHGELCPSQIILETKGRVKLLRAAPEILDLWTGTMTPTFLPRIAFYQSRCQTIGTQSTFKDDIYAFGVLLYRLTVGAYPYQGENLPSLIQQVLSHPLPPLELPEGYPPNLASTITRCLDRDPANRFDSILDVVKSLYPETVFRSLNIVRVRELDLAAFRHLQLSKYEEALEVWREAFEIAPDNVYLLNNLGVALSRLDRHEEAGEMFEQAVRQAPHIGRLRYHHAGALIKCDQKSLAKAELHDAVLLDPRLKTDGDLLTTQLLNSLELDERTRPRHMWASHLDDEEGDDGPLEDSGGPDDGAGVPRRPRRTPPSASAARQFPQN